VAQITSADVLLVAPELTGVTSGQWTAILADVYTEIVVANWGTEAKANRAAKQLAAHMATVSGRAGAGGAVQSQSVGGVSISFAVQATAGTGLHSTSYGQEYARLLRLYHGGPWVP
jgi:hypothetical protein